MKKEHLVLALNRCTANISDLLYLAYPFEWNSDQWNNSLNVGYNHSYKYVKGAGNIQASLRSSALGSDYDYAYLNLGLDQRNQC